MYVTGVVHSNNPEWLIDAIMHESVDITFEQHMCDCPGEDGYHDMCWETVGNEDRLIGFMECEPDDSDAWFAYTGEYGSFGYKPDPEAEYSAIVREINTQVVHSQWVQQCHKCSPCYPGQGDLDTPGSVYHAYTLPPDVWGENVPKGHIRKVEP